MSSVVRTPATRNSYARLMDALEDDPDLKMRDEAVLKRLLRCPPVVGVSMDMYPAPERLARKLKSSPDTVRRSLRRLCRDGWIVVTKQSRGGTDRSGKGITNHYGLGPRLLRVLIGPADQSMQNAGANLGNVHNEITSRPLTTLKNKNMPTAPSVAVGGCVPFPFKSERVKASTMSFVLKRIWEETFHRPYDCHNNVGWEGWDDNEAAEWLAGNTSRPPCSYDSGWRRCELTHVEVQKRYAAYLQMPEWKHTRYSIASFADHILDGVTP